MEDINIQAVFSGRVQGVGFRATCRHHAVKLGLKGFVRNLSDGNVELVAIGKQEAIERLLQLLKNEIFADCITSLDVQWLAINQAYSDFSIRK